MMNRSSKCMLVSCLTIAVASCSLMSEFPPPQQVLSEGVKNIDMSDHFSSIIKDKLDIFYDKIFYGSISCRTKWNQECAGDYKIEALPGWQACKPIFTEDSRGRDARFSITPMDWYTNDPENPDRFRSFNVHIEAKGSQSIFDQWGSDMVLVNVGLRMIPVEDLNKDRFAKGCQMPSH